MSLDVYCRRKYRQGKFVYLLDDDEKTAWIDKGHIGRCRSYRLPDHVMIDGERYTIESVEIGAFYIPGTLRHLVIPDSINYIDENAFSCPDTLRSVYIGKGVKYLDNFNNIFNPINLHFEIDKDNPYLKYEDGLIMTKDGKKVLACRKDYRQIVIPEGVEEINHYAFSGFSKLEAIELPRTLRRARDNSFSCLSKLRNAVLPEGFEICGTQCFMDDENLAYVDLPSTITDLGWETFMNCRNLQTIILRTSKMIEKVKGCFEGVPTENCSLYVPPQLVEQYRQHPDWGEFGKILPITKLRMIFICCQQKIKYLCENKMAEVMEPKIGDKMKVSPQLTAQADWIDGEVIDVEHNPFTGLVISIKDKFGRIFFGQSRYFVAL